jgi:hypothetical protein
MAKGKQNSKAAEKGGSSGKDKKADSKSKDDASDEKTGKTKGAQSINVRHILVSYPGRNHSGSARQWD